MSAVKGTGIDGGADLWGGRRQGANVVHSCAAADRWLHARRPRDGFVPTCCLSRQHRQRTSRYIRLLGLPTDDTIRLRASKQQPVIRQFLNNSFQTHASTRPDQLVPQLADEFLCLCFK